MNALNKILAERERWTEINMISGAWKGIKPPMRGWITIPTYDDDESIDRVIRGLDVTDRRNYVEELQDNIDEYDVASIVTATPQQKRAALAKVFDVEEGE